MQRLGEQPVPLYENLLRDANEDDLLPRLSAQRITRAPSLLTESWDPA
jgi:hypothetical protein